MVDGYSVPQILLTDKIECDNIFYVVKIELIDVFITNELNIGRLLFTVVEPRLSLRTYCRVVSHDHYLLTSDQPARCAATC